MSSSSSFEKIGECLYRNASSGTYFALVKRQGKQIRRSLETGQLREARRKLSDFKKDIERIDIGSSRTSLAMMVARYQATLGSQSRKTLEAKNRTCARIVNDWPGGADRQLSKIKPSEVKEFLVAYSGASNYNQARAVVRTIFQMAVDDGVIVSSPAEKTDWRKSEKPIRDTPTRAEFRNIVQHIRSQPFSDTRDEAADLVEFMGLAGLGQAEAAALTWQNVNFQTGQIVAFRKKTRTGYVVPIFPQLRPLLERRFASAHRKYGGNPPGDERVFSISNAKRALESAVERLTLPNYTPRSFRRMFITDALERGVDVKVIAQWQGHQDGGKLILDTYSHVRPTHSENMAKLMTGV